MQYIKSTFFAAHSGLAYERGQHTYTPQNIYHVSNNMRVHKKLIKEDPFHTIVPSDSINNTIINNVLLTLQKP